MSPSALSARTPLIMATRPSLSLFSKIAKKIDTSIFWDRIPLIIAIRSSYPLIVAMCPSLFLFSKIEPFLGPSISWRALPSLIWQPVLLLSFSVKLQQFLACTPLIMSMCLSLFLFSEIAAIFFWEIACQPTPAINLLGRKIIMCQIFPNILCRVLI